MKKIKRLIAQTILFMIEEIKDDTSYSADDTVKNAEAVKLLTEAIKNLR